MFICAICGKKQNLDPQSKSSNSDQLGLQNQKIIPMVHCPPERNQFDGRHSAFNQEVLLFNVKDLTSLHFHLFFGL